MTSRERIISAAIQVFSEKGKIGAHMETIAAKASINKAMIYYIFRGKDELYREVLRKIYREMMSEFTPHSADIGKTARSDREKLKAHIETIFTVFSTHQDYTRIIIDAMANGAAEISETLHCSSAGHEKPMPLSELESIISKSGVVKEGTDPTQLGMSIIGMVLIFYLSRPLGNIFGVDDRDEAFFLERRKKSIIDLILNGVLVRKEKTESAYA